MVTNPYKRRNKTGIYHFKETLYGKNIEYNYKQNDDPEAQKIPTRAFYVRSLTKRSSSTQESYKDLCR